MFADTIRNAFRQQTRRRNQQKTRFAAELFEERLQLSAVGIAAALETTIVEADSYPEDSDGQYSEDAILDPAVLESVSIDTSQQNPNPANAFPNTPEAPNFELISEARLQQIVFPDAAEASASSLEFISPALASPVTESGFSPLAIASLLDTQQVDTESDLNRALDLIESQESALLDPLQNTAESESLGVKSSEADQQDPEAMAVDSATPEQINSESATTTAVPVADQQIESPAVSETAPVDLDGFFAADPAPYIDGRTAALLAGMSVPSKGFLSRKSRRSV